MLLSLVDVFVAARDQIFLGAAGWWESELFHAVMGRLFAVLAAFVTARVAHHGGRETPEAVTGWVFLVATSGSILLMSHNRLGMEEINRLLSSTIIGAHRQDVWRFLGLTVLIALEPDMARVAGLRIGLWNGLLSAWLGIVIGFASLVLTALIAKNLGRTARSLFFLAPCISLGTGVIAFILANHYDFPPSQTAAACLCALLAGAWLLRAVRPR